MTRENKSLEDIAYWHVYNSKEKLNLLCKLWTEGLLALNTSSSVPKIDNPSHRSQDKGKSDGITKTSA